MTILLQQKDFGPMSYIRFGNIGNIGNIVKHNIVYAMNPSNHTVAKIKQIPQTCQGIYHKFNNILHQLQAAVPPGKSFEKCTE